MPLARRNSSILLLKSIVVALLFIGEHLRKKAAIGLSTEALQKLQAQHPAMKFSLFKAKLRPPGRGRYIREHYAEHQFAAYDFVIFISVDSENSRQTLMSSPTFQQLVQKLNQLAHKTTITQASNIRQIGPVPPLAGHTFLFNYFSAENTAQNLGIWEYTASWFEKETQLKNSVLLLPDSSSSYSIINHCSWPSIWDILLNYYLNRPFVRMYWITFMQIMWEHNPYSTV